MRRIVVMVVLAGLTGMILGIMLAPDPSALFKRMLTATRENCRACHTEPGVKRDRPPTASPNETVPQQLKESFKDGKTQLTWQTFPGFSPDPLEPISSTGTPEKDGWVGQVTNRTFGGFASLAFSGNKELSDYSVEAWVYVKVVPGEQGPLNGIAIRVDPENRRFYRLAAQFGSDSKLTLAYVGADVNNFPVYLKEWSADDIPGGVPNKSGWHRMKIRAAGNDLWVYWDDQELPGCPVSDERINAGYFGVYANFVGGSQVTETLVDEIIMHAEK